MAALNTRLLRQSWAAGKTRELRENESPVAGNYANADNMTIAAVIAPGFDFKSGDMVLAYVNGELRGKAKPLHNAELNADTYFLNIAGDAEQPVVFMVERAGAGNCPIQYGVKL